MNSPARWNSCVTSKSRRAVGSRLFGGTCEVAENWGHPPSKFSPKAGPGGALPCCILPTRALFSLLQALFLHFCASCWEILNGPQAWGCGTVLYPKSYKTCVFLGENTWDKLCLGTSSVLMKRQYTLDKVMYWQNCCDFRLTGTCFAFLRINGLELPNSVFVAIL